MASAYIASGRQNVLYKELVQHAKQLSILDRAVAPKEIALIARVSTKKARRLIKERGIKPCFDAGERSKRYDILDVMKALRVACDE